MLNLGKRNLGLGTAASPGDTLYVPLQFFNDSGASISIGSTLSVTDIEVFKNGGVSQRATDSGYAILGDTGNFDSRIGLKMISIQLYNTADDASFYANGSAYQVAIDSVTVDGRTVRFWPAVFEIGEPRANVVQVNSDTGAASVLALFAGTGGTLSPTGGFDTGSVDNNSYLTADAKRLSGDTGAADVLRQFAATNGTLSPTGELDTGSVANSSYLPADVTRWLGTAAASPTLAGVPKVEVSTLADTGIQNRLDKIAADTDTGIQSSVLVTGFSDTGINDRLAKILADTDTGIQSAVNVVQIGGDTGAANQLKQGYATTPTYWVQADVQQVDGDTGAADVLQKFADTTGALSPSGELDTGSGTLSVSASTDTGSVANAVWNSLRSQHTVAGSFGESDTGINNRLAVIAADTDTGIQSSVNVTGLSDTGVNERLTAIETKTNSLTFSVSGMVDANIQYVNDVQITGTGDTGTGNTWRPA